MCIRDRNVYTALMIAAIVIAVCASLIVTFCGNMERLRVLCVEGITANAQRCREMVLNSIGIVTAAPV